MMTDEREDWTLMRSATGGVIVAGGPPIPRDPIGVVPRDKLKLAEAHAEAAEQRVRELGRELEEAQERRLAFLGERDDLRVKLARAAVALREAERVCGVFCADRARRTMRSALSEIEGGEQK